MPKQLLFVFLFWVLLTSCQGKTPAPNTPTPFPSPQPTIIPTPVPTDLFFPQNQISGTDQMQAGLIGKLILVDGCPRAEVGDGSSFLLFWPYNYVIDRNTNPAQIHDETGQIVAQIGDYVEMGGGTPPLTEDKLANGCAGPVWIVGAGPRVLDAFFPQHTGGGVVSRTDLLEGELLLLNGCLRLKVNENNNFLLVWPTLSFKRDKKSSDVYDGAGRIQARVGEKIKVRGGRAQSLKPPPGTMTELLLAQPLPQECASGPYWIVDYIEK